MDLATIQAGGGGPLHALARGALAALAVPYGTIAARRLAAFDAGRRAPERLPVRVVCVGNLTAGGTGKTPFVAWLVERARAVGRRPAVLARGYGPAPLTGSLSDEGSVLRDLLGADVPIVEDAARVRGGRALVAEHPEVDLVVLDDGFQHRRLARDADIVLVDATNPFGYDRLLPRGLLREPKTGLRRASAVVVTRVERASASALEALLDEVAALAPEAVRATARTSARALVGPDGGERDLSALRGEAVFAWAAIGNPRAFEALLGDLGARVVGRRFERDHRALSARDVERVARLAAGAGARLVVVTRKDAVKLRALPVPLPGLAVLDVRTDVTSGEDALLRVALGT